MENTILQITPQAIEKQESPHPAFITANTTACSIDEIRNLHHIPSFVKSNEALISQIDFIDITANLVANIFKSERINAPEIRLSHPIKGRIPDAKHKKANELEEWEKTIYYERSMFVIEIPSVYEDINGNRLSLTVGGVKAYNQDNLYANDGADQHFKVFIGFQNKVCTNLCLSTDGYYADLKVKNLQQLTASIDMLFKSYGAAEHLHQLERMNNYSLTEQQFALLVGRCRMYQHLPKGIKDELYAHELLLTDTQIGAVVKDYYHDLNFGVDALDSISLWRLYNLFTGANKSSYIDSFLDRSVNAFQFVKQLQNGLDRKQHNWFLN
jgi:hypothetical protein